MAQEKEFNKLSTARGFAKIGKLFQAKDHLLLAQTMGFTEEYRRFYFRDIQTILLRPSKRRMVWAFIWAAFFILFFAGGYPFHLHNLSYLWLIFFGTCFAVNLLQGPGCVCSLKTAIQTIEIPIIRRNKALKILNRLKPLIEVAQQNLPETTIPGAVSIPLSVSPSAPSVDSTPLEASKGPKPFRAQAHWTLFITLLLFSLLQVSRFFQHALSLYILLSLLLLTAMGASVFALIFQFQSPVPVMLKRVTIGAFAFLILNYGISLFFRFYMAISHPQKSMNEWAWIKWSAAQAPDSTGFGLFLAGFIIVGGLLFGLLGLVELSFYRKQQKQL